MSVGLLSFWKLGAKIQIACLNVDNFVINSIEEETKNEYPFWNFAAFMNAPLDRIWPH